MSTLEINIVSAEKSLFSGEATFVAATGVQGELGFYYGHAPLLTLLAPGQIRVQYENREEVFWVSGGILEVQPDQIIVLADAAERAADLDEALALAAKTKAENMLKNQTAEFNTTKATAELLEITSQLEAIDRLRKLAKK